MKNKSVDMTNGPLLSKIIVFVIPLLLTNLLQQLYNFTDMMIVGKFAGSNALAAVGATSSLTNLFFNIITGLAVGVSTVAAQANGAKNAIGIERTVHTSIGLSLVLSVIIGFLGIILCKPLLWFMGTPETIIDKSALYMRIIFAGAPVSAIYNFGAGLFRAKGNTKLPLYVLAISGLINVILNCVFVIGFKMAVEGVAIPTVLSQLMSASIILYCLNKEEYPFKLNFNKIKIYKEEVTRIFKIGLPISVQGAIFSVTNILVQSSVNSFGEIVVAGGAAASNVNNILYTIINAPSHAATIFAGQNFGAKKFNRIPKILYNCIGIVSVTGVVCGALLVGFREQIISLFANDKEVVKYGCEIMTYICAPYFVCGIMESLSGVLRGINKSFVSMINSIVGLCGVRIVWVLTVFAMHRILFVLYSSYFLSWVFVIILHTIMFIYYYRKLKKDC